MKKILEFNSPEDDDFFDLHNQGPEFYRALVDMDEYLRNLIKHKSKEELAFFTPEIARKQLHDFLQDRGIDLNIIHN